MAECLIHQHQLWIFFALALEKASSEIQTKKKRCSTLSLAHTKYESNYKLGLWASNPDPALGY